MVTLCNWRKYWRLQVELVPTSEKNPDGLSSTDKFIVALETFGLNLTELSADCHKLIQFPEQVELWRLVTSEQAL